MVHMTKEEITKMQIKRIENEIRDTPYHKGTEHYIGKLRAKLSNLKDKLIEGGTKKGGGAGGYAVKKQGDATIVLVGPPSAGKSTLLNKLTNAQSKVAPYAFTTVTVIPGMMDYKDAKIQILDVPGLIEGAETGKGRGREVLSVIRGSDLLIIMSDVSRPEAVKRIVQSLENNGIRINKERPNIKVEKTHSGGIIVHTNIKQNFKTETIKEVVREMNIKNAEISIMEKLTMERLIDSFSKNRVYVPALYVLNKMDEGSKIINNDYLHISAEKKTNLDKLRDEIWEKLNFVRVYLVRADEEPNYDNPLIVKKDTNLAKVAQKIGSDFAEDKKRAKIWGSGAKFPSQEVSLSTKVKEGMQVRFI